MNLSLRNISVGTALVATMWLLTPLLVTGDDLSAMNQTELRKSVDILAKNTLISVNQGNLTGNYTVLRDLSSPGFRERNSAADLAAIFENLRQQKIDLSPIVLIDPVLTKPKLSEEGLLLLKGHFPSEPVRINFELMYLKSEAGGWMIHGVSINTAQAEGVVANETQPATPPLPAGQGTRPSRVVPASSPRSDGETTASRPKPAPAPAPASSTPIRREK